MMKLFDEATLRLTGWYLAIIMLISLSFSAVIYGMSRAEIDRSAAITGPLSGQFYILDIEEFEKLRRQQVLASNARLVSGLAIVNLVTLIIGGTASYFLARRTLRPIQSAMQAQGRFTSDASHELRTPLAVMQSETEIALRDSKLSKADAKGMLVSNLEEIAKLRSLTDRLLLLSNDDPLPLSRVSLESAAIAAMNRHITSAQDKDISVENTVPSLSVMADASALEDVISILLDNAIKYSPAGSSVVIAAARSGKCVRLMVTDSGPGIAEADLPYVFDRFYRADTSRTSSGVIAGQGLGLSIARRIMDKLGGDITAANRPAGYGAVMTVTLTAAEPAVHDMSIRTKASA